MDTTPHMRTVDELLKKFNVSEENGLSKDEVENALKKYGPNGRSLYSFLCIYRAFVYRINKRHYFIYNFLCLQRKNAQIHIAKMMSKKHFYLMCVL